jgi:hypothetical protein
MPTEFVDEGDGEGDQGGRDVEGSGDRVTAVGVGDVDPSEVGSDTHPVDVSRSTVARAGKAMRRTDRCYRRRTWIPRSGGEERRARPPPLGRAPGGFGRGFPAG